MPPIAKRPRLINPRLATRQNENCETRTIGGRSCLYNGVFHGLGRCRAGIPKGCDNDVRLIGKLVSAPNRREDLIAILHGIGTRMPGCLSYVIAKDAADENSIWIIEVWDNEVSHQASLLLPEVKDVIARTKPLISEFSRIAVTHPVSGVETPK